MSAAECLLGINGDIPLLHTLSFTQCEPVVVVQSDRDDSPLPMNVYSDRNVECPPFQLAITTDHSRCRSYVHVLLFRHCGISTVLSSLKQAYRFLQSSSSWAAYESPTVQC